MLKKALKIIKDPKLLAVMSVIISVVLVVLLTPYLLYPRFTSWRDISAKNDQEEARLSKITSNVSAIAAVDEENLEEFKDLADRLVPSEEDKLRVASILDVLVRNSGMTLTSLKVITKSTGVGTTTPPATPTAGSGASGPTPSTPQTPSGSAGSGATATSTQGNNAANPAAAQAVISSEYEVSVVADGSMPQAIRLLDTLVRVRRTMGVYDLVVGAETGDGGSVNEIKVSANFTLPLEGGTTPASPEESINLTQADREYLLDLISRLNIDASPAGNPTGRTDPFK